MSMALSCGKIQDSSEMRGLTNLWTVLKSEGKISSDVAFLDLLLETVHQNVGVVPKK